MHQIKKNILSVSSSILAATLMLGLSHKAFAGSNQAMIYQGRILRPDGTPINSGNINFTVSVYSPSPSKCLLYSETQTVNMTDSQGMFS